MIRTRRRNPTMNSDILGVILVVVLVMTHMLALYAGLRLADSYWVRRIKSGKIPTGKEVNDWKPEVDRPGG